MTFSLLSHLKNAIKLTKTSLSSKMATYFGTMTTVFSPFIVAIAFVLSIGPQLQTYVLALFYADSTSIYGSLYKKELGLFPTIRSWLVAGLDWRFLLLATAIVLYSMRKPSPRLITVFVAISSFVSLCILDAVTATTNKTWTLQFAAETLVMNLFGAIAISMIALLLAAAYDFTFGALPPRLTHRRLICSIPIATGGIIISALVYYVSAFVYKPIPVSISAALAAPASGAAFYSPSKSARNDTPHTNEAPAFQFLPQDNHTARLTWLSPNNTIVAHWHRAEHAAHFTATIEFFADCFDRAIDGARLIGAHTIRYSSVNDLQIQFDPGGSSLVTLASDPLEGELRLRHEGSFFWLENETGKLPKYTQFVDDNARVDLTSSDGAAFFISAELFSDSDRVIAPKSRSIVVTADGMPRSFSIEPDRRASGDNKLVCRSIPTTKISGTTLATQPTTSIGALVRIRRNPADQTYSSDASQLSLANGYGWIAIETDATELKLRTQQSGKLTFISFQNGIVRLTVDNQVLSTDARDRFVAFGDFDVSFQSFAEVLLAGTTYALWKNGERMNPTKFESLGENTRFTIIGALGTAFLWLASLCVSLWKVNRPMYAVVPKSRHR
jgi:hypothetical protein